MFKFALKNLKTKKLKFTLTTITMFICILISIIFFNVASQAKEGVINTASSYDTIIGGESSALELTLSTMFYMDYSVDTIPYEYYEKYQNDKNVSEIYPFASGDTYRNVKIIGTLSGYLKNIKLKSGSMFEDDKEFQAVIGASVAEEANLKVGDTFISTHGSAETGHNHEDTPYTVVGIMNKSNTSNDLVIFTEISSVWCAHEDHEEEHEGELEDEHEHEHEEGELTAIILKTTNLSAHTKIVNELKEVSGVQAVNPATELRKLLNSISMVENIIYIMTAFVIVIAVMMIYVTTTSSVSDSKEDIILMRLIGIKQKSINSIIFIQTMFSFIIASILAILFKFIVLNFANMFTSGSFGIIILPMKFYFGEIVIIIGILILTIISMIISLIPMFRKDPLDI